MIEAALQTERSGLPAPPHVRSPERVGYLKATWTLKLKKTNTQEILSHTPSATLCCFKLD